MLKWIDRNTFKIETKYCIYNYDNLVSMGIYTYKNENTTTTKLVLKTCNGDEIPLYSCYSNDESKVKKLEEDFTNFYQSRPGNNNSNKINIK